MDWWFSAATSSTSLRFSRSDALILRPLEKMCYDLCICCTRDEDALVFTWRGFLLDGIVVLIHLLVALLRGISRCLGLLLVPNVWVSR